jgi:anti-anti-sigma regulatory factor
MQKPVPFQVIESRDRDGRLRIALIGGLDQVVADRLYARLEQLSSDGVGVLLDLSRLESIDGSGVRALVRAVQHGNGNGHALLEIGHEITPAVQTVIDPLGVATVLWPTGRSQAAPASDHAGSAATAKSNPG